MSSKNRYAVMIALLTFVCALCACDYGRMWETPAVRPHEEPMLTTDADIVPFDGGEAVYRAMSIYVLKSPLAEGDPEDLEKGKALYSTYCAQCHGKDHDGRGTVGQSFQPLPRDLRLSSVQNMIEGKLFKGISYGTPRGRQPPLAATISVRDRWRIIAYVKSLGTRN